LYKESPEKNSNMLSLPGTEVPETAKVVMVMMMVLGALAAPTNLPVHMSATSIQRLIGHISFFPWQGGGRSEA